MCLVDTSDARKLTQLFKTRLNEDYEERQCGRNVMRLIRNAHELGINVDDARGGIRESTGEQFPPSEKNCYYHAFLELEELFALLPRRPRHLK